MLGEYAITFMAMLNEGYRRQYRHYMMLSRISDLPHLDKSLRQEFYRQMEWNSQSPIDILSSSNNGSTDAEILKALGG